MKRWYDFVLIFLIIFILVFAYLVHNDPYNRAKRDRDFLGNEKADVVVIEFGDYLDPSSAVVEKSMIKIRENFIDDIKFIYVHYPSINSSRIAAMAAECAGYQEKFELMHNKLYENYMIINEANIYVWADEIKLKTTDFRDCMDNEIFSSIIDRDYSISNDLKIERLPLIFINKNRVEGIQDYEVYEELISLELSKIAAN